MFEDLSDEVNKLSRKVEGLNDILGKVANVLQGITTSLQQEGVKLTMSWDGVERRHRNRDNSFSPSTAFEGYVKATLDDLGDRLNALPCESREKRLNKIENDVANMRGRAAGIGAIAGLVATFVMWLVGLLRNGK